MKKERWDEQRGNRVSDEERRELKERERDVLVVRR